MKQENEIKSNSGDLEKAVESTGIDKKFMKKEIKRDDSTKPYFLVTAGLLGGLASIASHQAYLEYLEKDFGKPFYSNEFLIAYSLVAGLSVGGAIVNGVICEMYDKNIL